jgi:hypothetical protein
MNKSKIFVIRDKNGKVTNFLDYVLETLILERQNKVNFLSTEEYQNFP